MTWRDAIEHVLRDSPDPMHYGDITARIISEKLRKSLGATPASTVNAHIAASIKHDGANSPYLRVAKGTFSLRNGQGNQPQQKPDPATGVRADHEDQYDVVSSFGMFWRRSAVEWRAKPRLLGVQQLGATPVDFCGQLGIYLLYDGREVIYVGRSTDRPLGRRLYEHTLDRLSVRWDRFSWFGLLPVTDTGTLNPLPTAYDASKLIPALEAILIEAVEPRQNRKRGDDLSEAEYLQLVDPEVKRREAKAVLDEALGARPS